MTPSPDISNLLPDEHQIRARRHALVAELAASPAPRALRSRRVLTSLGVIVVLGGATVTYAAVGIDFSKFPTPRETGAIKTSAVPAVQDQIKDSFALFRDQPPSPIPAELVEQIASPQRHGRNAALARSIQTANGAGWAIPGDGYLCLAVPTTARSYATTCVPTELAIDRGLWLRLSGAREDAKALDTIVVPDSVDTVISGASELKVPETGVISEFVDADGTSGPRLTPAPANR